MKTDKEMISDLIKRKEAYDAKREAANRRLKIAASALAVVILTASLPVTAFIVSNRRANAPGTEPGPVTAETVSTDTVTEEATAADVTETEGTETVPSAPVTDAEQTSGGETTAEPDQSRASETEEPNGNYSPGTKFSCRIAADYYEEDKTDQIVLTNDDHGRKTWLNRSIAKQYGIDLRVDEHPEGYDFARYKDDIYGYKKKSDVYEIELKLKNTNEWAGDEYLIRIESDDCSEILSEVTIKSVFPTVKDPAWNSFEPGDYVSIPLKFRFTGDKKLTELKVYIFKRSAGNEFHTALDHITEAEEYFASGKSMADKAYPSWKELRGDFNPLNNAAHSYFFIRFIEINGYDFLLDGSNSYAAGDLYERAAVYFGETDENGVPLFITGQGPTEYFNPFRIPLISDWPGYDSNYNRRDGNAAR